MPEPAFDVARRWGSTELRARSVLQGDRPIRNARLNTLFSGGLAERWCLLAVAVGTIVVVDALFILLGAATWRREEVMAQR